MATSSITAPKAGKLGRKLGNEGYMKKKMLWFKTICFTCVSLSACQAMAYLQEIEDVRVAPLIQTRWSQSSWGGSSSAGMVFNKDTPGNSVCGCGVTAAAQLMRYHCYPNFELDSMENDCVYHDQSTNFPKEVLHLTTKGGKYDWLKMPLRYDTHPELDDVERGEIAKLTSDIGISFGVSYMFRDHETNTDKETLLANLKNIWKYGAGYYIWLTVTQGDSLPDWAKRAIFGSLNARRPVVVWCKSDDDGHTFLLDGYGFHAGRYYVHANCGWHGRSDGWYALMDDIVSDLHTLRYIAFNVHPSDVGQILSGRVTDGYGVPIHGAVVSLVGEEDGVETSAMTDEKGIYYFVVNKASSFRVTAEKDGVAVSTNSVRITMPQTLNTDATNSKILLKNAQTIGNLFDVDFRLPIPAENRTYSVKFDLGRNGKCVSGGPLIQSVSCGTMPAVPLIEGTDGWSFLAWQPAVAQTTNDCVYRAIYVDSDGDSAPDCYVDIHAQPAGDGLTPETALTSMLNGMSQVSSGGVVRVAAGIYPPVKYANNKVMMIKSSSGKHNTILDGGGTNRVVQLGTNYVDNFNTVMRGFTIRNGYRSSEGYKGGVHAAGAGAYAGTFIDCDFSNNFIDGSGAAAYGAALVSCRLFDNFASTNGGAVGRCVVRNSALFNNTAGGSGGAASQSVLVGCTVMSNSAAYGGGAYRATLIDCDVMSNSATYGGGVWSGQSENSSLTACRVVGNYARLNGGGIGRCTVTNSVISNNVADGSGGAAYQSLLVGCSVESNSAVYGGGMYRSSLVDCSVQFNCAKWGGGMFAGSAECSTIVRNTSNRSGAGAYRSRLTNVAVAFNSATNTATVGGGCYECTNLNCTVFGNTATGNGGGTYNCVSTNCIVWGNSASQKYPDVLSGTSVRCLSKNKLDGDNITGDPLMYSPSTGDFRLCPGSPCLEAGIACAGVGDFDLIGHQRVQGRVVDIGACEGSELTTLSTGVEVPYSWLDQYPAVLSSCGGDYEKAAQQKTGKGFDSKGQALCVWHDYLAGTVPTNSDDKFTARITMVDGEPIIGWTPELPTDQADLRKYTTYGKAKLQDAEWTVVNGDAAKYNFFKVTVEMK